VRNTLRILIQGSILTNAGRDVHMLGIVILFLKVRSMRFIMKIIKITVKNKLYCDYSQ
jgi:hypothetical protein